MIFCFLDRRRRGSRRSSDRLPADETAETAERKEVMDTRRQRIEVPSCMQACLLACSLTQCCPLLYPRLGFKSSHSPPRVSSPTSHKQPPLTIKVGSDAWLACTSTRPTASVCTTERSGRYHGATPSELRRLGPAMRRPGTGRESKSCVLNLAGDCRLCGRVSLDTT